MIGAALSVVLLMTLPVDFPYPGFAAILLFNGLSMGAFAAPKRAAINAPARYDPQVSRHADAHAMEWRELGEMLAQPDRRMAQHVRREGTRRPGHRAPARRRNRNPNRHT
ncbi:MAG: hypothetical protein ACREFJ_01440 [Acetobacteraceae bacterium]